MSKLKEERFVEKKDLPYFGGKVPAPLTFVKENKSPYFIFYKDFTCQKVEAKWELLQYIKNIFLRLSFKKDNGYVHYVSEHTFTGHLMPSVEETINLTKGLERGPLRAYVYIPSKSSNYDFVLGEVDDEGKNIVNIFRCISKDNPEVIRNLIVDMNCQTIPVDSLELMKTEKKNG